MGSRSKQLVRLIDESPGRRYRSFDGILAHDVPRFSRREHEATLGRHRLHIRLATMETAYSISTGSRGRLDLLFKGFEND